MQGIFPASLADPFQGAAYLDLRAILPLKQISDGNATHDRILLATNTCIFICNIDTGDITRYIPYDNVLEAHWYPLMHIAVLVCDDGFDFAAATPSSSSLSLSSLSDTPPAAAAEEDGPFDATTTTFHGGGAVVDGGSQPLSLTRRSSTESSAPAAKVPTRSSSSLDPKEALSQLQQRVEVALSTTSHRVRSTTMNFGKRIASVLPLNSNSSSRSTTQRSFDTAPTARVLLCDEMPAEAITGAPRRPATFLQQGYLPVADMPTTLPEFLHWSSLLSTSREYHGVGRRSFGVHVMNGVQRLNVSERYRLHRPSEYSLPLPEARRDFEMLSASPSDRAAALARYVEEEGPSTVQQEGEEQENDTQASVPPEVVVTPAAGDDLDKAPPASSESLAGTVQDEGSSSLCADNELPPSHTSGRMRSRTLFCPSVVATRDEASDSSRKEVVSAPQMPWSGQGASLSPHHSPQGGETGSVDGDDGDPPLEELQDSFVMVDRPTRHEQPGTRNPPPHLSVEGQLEWWKAHCRALEHHNVELHKHVDELHIELALAQHGNPSTSSGGGVAAGNTKLLTRSKAEMWFHSQVRKPRIPF